MAASRTSGFRMPLTELWLVRHGQSRANVDSVRAEQDGLDRVPDAPRDADVGLTDDGRAQVATLADQLRALPAAELPSCLYSSPYERALYTARTAAPAQLSATLSIDERLRDRELGVLHGLTNGGMEHLYPEEQQRQQHLGQFYYRPPGGESWADVILRLRSFWRDLEDSARVDSVQVDIALIVSHDLVILCLCYICLGWTEQDLLDASSSGPVPYATVLRLTRSGPDGAWVRGAALD